VAYIRKELKMVDYRPWELVTSDDYFCEVLINMGHCANVAGVKKETETNVRFGTKGTGVNPNYQIETPKGITRFAGNSHKFFHEEHTKSFEDEHLSKESFTNVEVQTMLGKIRQNLKLSKQGA
jgi:hypothetical protein